MKKTVLTKAYTFEIQETAKPVPTDDQVLLKVIQVGICASDMQMYHGLHKYMTYPVTVGHEVCAIVESVGRNVKDFKPGDKVTAEPQDTCGSCYMCRTGHMNVCDHLQVLGVHKDGFACEYVVADSSFLRNCNGLSDDAVTLLEPAAVGFGAVRRAGDPRGKNIAVIGAGTIGNLTGQAFKAMGAQSVLITDIKQKKLEVAKACGADFAVNTQEVTLREAIADAFGEQGADVIVDCAATPGSFASILQAARKYSTIIITGNFKKPVEVELPVIQRQELSVLGHMMYTPDDFANAIRAVRDERMRLDLLATQHFPLTEIADAYRFADEHPDDVMKAILVV